MVAQEMLEVLAEAPKDKSRTFPMFSSKSSKTLFLLAGFLLLGFLIYFYWGSIISPAKLTTVGYVQRNIPDFKEGYSALSDGDFRASAEHFERALGFVQDSKQEAYVKSLAGYAWGRSGDFERGIKELKSVAGNESNADTHRAYAIEFMAEIYDRSNKDPRVTALIFNSPPYSDFLKGNDVEGAYKNLYEYAATLYPTGLASYRLAIIDLYTHATTTVQSFEKGIAALTDEVALLSSFGVVDGALLSDKYLGIANLQGILALRGGGDAAQAEVSFKKSLELAPVDTTRYINVGYHYALFLSQLEGGKRSADIAKLLAPFYDPAYKDTFFFNYFQDKDTQKDEKVRINLRHIGSADARFKSLMVSFGWNL